MNVRIIQGQMVLLMVALVVVACDASEKGSGKLDVGLKVTDQASAEDVGLPAYPGSKPYKDADQSSSGANLGLSTPAFGIKVVAANLETNAEPGRVAAFYTEALSKYGRVIECSEASNPKSSREHTERTDELSCDTIERGSHKVVYKVGTKKNQRIVSVTPHGTGTRFSLVHLDIRD